MPTACLIDGDFFLKRYRRIFGSKTANEVAHGLHRMCRDHLVQKDAERDLYRIYFYDCPPLMKKAHHPLTGEPVDFAESRVAHFRNELHAELKKLRKLALRLGYLDERHGAWSVRADPLKDLLAGRIATDQLEEDDIYYQVRQKGVEMRMGMDITALALKRQVDQIVLVAGDGDFVPAAKLARREGVDFVLDPMWHPVPDALHEHVDGLRSTCPRPGSRSAGARVERFERQSG